MHNTQMYWPAARLTAGAARRPWTPGNALGLRAIAAAALAALIALLPAAGAAQMLL